MRGSTGSFLGDIIAYATMSALLWVIAFIWQIITAESTTGSERMLTCVEDSLI